MKRAVILTAFLLTFLCVAQFFSCAQTGESGNTGKPDGGGTTTDTESVGTEYPELEAEDFGGAEITFLVMKPNEVNDRLREINVTEENGDILNDSVFRRNVIIEDKYNIKLGVVEANVADSISKAVNSGDDSFDAALGGIGDSYASAGKRYLLDLNDVPYIDLSNPWWNQDSVSGGSFAGKNYFAVSDINLLSLDNMAVMMFNKKIVSDLSLESPYDLVKSGEWTIDKFASMSRGISADLDGDGELGENDRYGFACNLYGSDCFLFGSGYSISKKNKDDIPEINTISESFIDSFTKVIQIMNDETVTLFADKKQYKSQRQTLPWNSFKEGRILFYVETSVFISLLRDMEIDFGLIPLPKADDQQEKYATFIHGYHSSAVQIPVTNTNLAMTGKILEDMAYQSHLYVRPAYYESTLRGKCVRDEESLDMLDYIFGHQVFDPAFYMTSFSTDLRSLCEKNSTDIASMFASKVEKYRGAIDKFVASVTEN